MSVTGPPFVMVHERFIMVVRNHRAEGVGLLAASVNVPVTSTSSLSVEKPFWLVKVPLMVIVLGKIQPRTVSVAFAMLRLLKTSAHRNQDSWCPSRQGRRPMRIKRAVLDFDEAVIGCGPMYVTEDHRPFC